jgi:hypothetical protein
MAKNYPHEIRIPRVLISDVGARTTGATGVLPQATNVVRPATHTTIDKSAPSPLADPSVGSSMIFSVGGNIRARAQGEGE